MLGVKPCVGYYRAAAEMCRQIPDLQRYAAKWIEEKVARSWVPNPEMWEKKLRPTLSSTLTPGIPLWKVGFPTSYIKRHLGSMCLRKSWSKLPSPPPAYDSPGLRLQKRSTSQSKLSWQKKKDKFVKREMFTNALLLCSKVQLSKVLYPFWKGSGFFSWLFWHVRRFCCWSVLKNWAVLKCAL